MERGIERYAEGAYDVAQRELEAALAAAPGHARALECLTWVRELAAGKKSLASGAYATVPEEESSNSGVSPLPLAPIIASVSAPSDEELPPRLAPVNGQLDETPDSVTREWSMVATTHNLPQLDVPELSEEQIANLLQMDGGRGFTLSRNSALPGVSEQGSAAQPARSSAPEDDDEEGDRTHVRLADSGPARVVEFTADAEDDTPLPSPVLPGILADDGELLASFSGGDRPDQTSDDAPSMATNPFVSQRLSELAAPLLGSLGDDLPNVPEADPPAVSFARNIEAALRRGAPREAFDDAERLAELPGTRSGEEQAMLSQVHEGIVGPLAAVPRYGKATPSLDSRSAFLLSRMDGAMSADDLLDVSGMPRPDALRILARLVVLGVVIMTRP